MKGNFQQLAKAVTAPSHLESPGGLLLASKQCWRRWNIPSASLPQGPGSARSWAGVRLVQGFFLGK